MLKLIKKQLNSLQACLLAGIIGIILPAEDLPAGKVDYYGLPCKAFDIANGCLVEDPSTGKELLALTNLNDTSGLQLILIDIATNTGRVISAPTGIGSWGMIKVPGNRLVLGTTFPASLLVFDLTSMEFIRSVSFPGERYVWNLALGKDGRVYCGTYPGAKLGALNLDTYELEDCGAPAPSNLYLRYVSRTPAGNILCRFNPENRSLIYYPDTKEFKSVPEQIKDVEYGRSFKNLFLVGSRVFEGETFTKRDTCQFPGAPPGCYVISGSSSEDCLFMISGKEVYRYGATDLQATLVSRNELPGGVIFGVTRSGVTYGARGQDYFWYDPQSLEAKTTQIPVEAVSRSIKFISYDGNGKVWGGPFSGQTLFCLDSGKRKSVNTSSVSNRAGSVSSVTFSDGNVYAASYSGGEIICYNPNEPWDQIHGVNPRIIASVGPNYICPKGGIIVGPDKKLYSGWAAQYGVYGGAVAITSPLTGQTEVIENPLGMQTVSGLAVDDRHVYLGTSVEVYGLPRKEGEPTSFGMMDLASKTIIFSQSFPVSSIKVGYDVQSKNVAVAVGSQIQIFNPEKRSFIEGLPENAPKMTSQSLSTPGDGKVYYGSDKSVVSLDFVRKLYTIVVDMPFPIEHIVAGRDGKIFVSSGQIVLSVTVR